MVTSTCDNSISEPVPTLAVIIPERTQERSISRIQKRQRRINLAFWIDWAPMLLLAISATVAGVVRLDAALTPDAVSAVAETPPAVMMVDRSK